MARAGKTAQEFIQDSFSPNVAVLCSSKVDNVVSRNNLSFIEMLQPFASMEWEGQFREPGGTVCIVKNWKLLLRDVKWKPLPPTEARRQLNNAAIHNFHEKTSSFQIDGWKFDIPQSTPWFDAWRETYLEVQFPSDHEYTKHFLSCIIVGTTLDENIIDTFNSLNQQYAQLQNVAPPKLPKWFTNGVLKSYLLLHDASSVTADKADTMFEMLKQNFGSSNCFMLAINSKTTLDPSLPTDYWAHYIKRSPETNVDFSVSQSTPIEPPAMNVPTGEEGSVICNQEGLHPLTTSENEFYDNANSLQTHSFSGSIESVNVPSKVFDYTTEIHGAGLNTSDITAIKKFLQDYASKAFLPYLEKQIAQLSEVVAVRKGVSRSLLSATKRWFGTGKGGNTTGNNTMIYTNDCPELQLRRLGDLWFMCGQWQRAFDVYHTAKREFYADSAWLCYAGALEMAAISAFMAGDSNRKTHGYMEESIVTYLNTCRMVQYAVRATLLSVLCLNSAGLHGEAAKQLIRMTSEDSDLRSAMLLEQAALCFLAGPGTKAMCRKYAFHMVLAGHRFSKAGQKKHAYRCYKQAYQIYSASGWRLATDHVQFALGRLAGALRASREAAAWLRGPLAPASSQPPSQQHAFLREYMLAHQQWIETDELKDQLSLLPLPILQRESTSILCVGPAPLSSPGRVPATSISIHSSTNDKQWAKLEEMLLQVAQGCVPMIFKPTIDLYTEEADGIPVVPQGEPIQIAITLWNPLNISLILKDLELLWQFIPSIDDAEGPSEIVSNEPMIATGNVLENNVIYGQKIKTVLMEGECKKMLTFSLTPLKVGELHIKGVAFKLINAGESGTENGNSIVIPGKLDFVSETNVRKRLNIKVSTHAPCLQMTFSETSTEALSGEMRSVDIEFRNVGPVDMKNVFLAFSHPDCIRLVSPEDKDDDFQILYEDKYREAPKNPDERAERLRAWREHARRHVHCGATNISRGGGARTTLLLRASSRAPCLRILAYYEPAVPLPASHKNYRLLRHVFNFKITEAVEFTVTPRRNLKSLSNEILENMNMAVEVKNVTSDKGENVTVEVLEASILSRQWKLTDITMSRNNEPLASHERLHLVFKGRRILKTLVEGVVEYSSIKVTKGHPSAVEDVNVPPYSKFLTDYKTNYLDNMELSYQDNTKSGLIQSMFVLRWIAYDKVRRREVIGQHCLWLDCFSKTSSKDTEKVLFDPLHLQLDELDSKLDQNSVNKSKKDNAVVFKLEHSKNISHNFKETKLCLVPIKINIVNCHGVPVKIFIDMNKWQKREACNEIGWAGALNTSNEVEAKELGVSVSLDKFESRQLHVSAVCAAPGTYLVGSAITVTVATEDTKPVTQFSNNTSLLIVSQV